MRVEFEQFADIGYIDFSDKADLTFLIGDNGVGKTFLLESYARINDYLVERYIDKPYFRQLLDTVEFNIISSEKTEEEKLSEGYQNKISSKYKLEIQFDFEEVKRQLSADLLEVEKDLSEIISKEIFFYELDFKVLKVDLQDNIGLNNEEQIFEVDFALKSDEFYDVDNTVDSDIGKRAISSISLKNKKGLGAVGRIVEFKEAKSIFEKFENSDFNDLKSMIVFSVSNLLSRKFIELNGLNNIIYIPSERVISMSAAVERLLTKEKFKHLRYSEMKFMQQYSSIKEASTYLNEASYEEINYSDEYRELIGGIPLFNEEGEMIYIKNKDGQKINRSLFSAKQNKLSPFFILESDFDRFLYNNKSGSLRGALPTLVIVEEPEAHLSLKGVMQMAKYIYHLAKDRKVIVSTHSDVLIARINNFYARNDSKIALKGYEILEKEPLNIFKNIELTELGLRSDFIESQLNFLFDETSTTQKNLDNSGEI